MCNFLLLGLYNSHGQGGLVCVGGGGGGQDVHVKLGIITIIAWVIYNLRM